MNQAEAATLVTMLVTSYPGARFDASNAVAYEAAIADLDARETQEALAELVRTFVPRSHEPVPSVAHIRTEVARLRKAREEADRARRRALSARSPAEFPSPEEWGRKVGDMLTEAERYDRMARKWYASKGKPYPGDPAQSILETVRAGARGEDISDRLGHVGDHVGGDMDEQERRHP